MVKYSIIVTRKLGDEIDECLVTIHVLMKYKCTNKTSNFSILELGLWTFVDLTH